MIIIINFSMSQKPTKYALSQWILTRSYEAGTTTGCFTDEKPTAQHGWRICLRPESWQVAGQGRDLNPGVPGSGPRAHPIRMLYLSVWCFLQGTLGILTNVFRLGLWSKWNLLPFFSPSTFLKKIFNLSVKIRFTVSNKLPKYPRQEFVSLSL